MKREDEVVVIGRFHNIFRIARHYNPNTFVHGPTYMVYAYFDLSNPLHVCINFRELLDNFGKLGLYFDGSKMLPEEIEQVDLWDRSQH